MAPTLYPRGTRVNDRYVLGDRLGHGTYGQVYRAHDEHLDVDCALKLLEPQRGQPATWREARALEQVRSEFLVPVINAEVVLNSDIRFITMPVMDGGDLNTHAYPHGVSTRSAVRWGQQLAHALDRVHAARLVHRDVKPGNAFLNNGDAILGDLGTAAAIDPITGYASAQGTTATLAPEAVSDSGHTHKASDVYSLAATVFYLLTGEYPIDARLPDDEQRRHIAAGRRRRIRDLAPHVSRSIAMSVEKSLSTDANRRHSDALAFGNALAGATDHRREWHRADHPGHIHCLRGTRGPTASAVTVCAVDVGGACRVTALLDTSRRPPHRPDVTVPSSQLARTLRHWTEQL